MLKSERKTPREGSPLPDLNDEGVREDTGALKRSSEYRPSSHEERQGGKKRRPVDGRRGREEAGLYPPVHSWVPHSTVHPSLPTAPWVHPTSPCCHHPRRLATRCAVTLSWALFFEESLGRPDLAPLFY